jgi:hypothetical protein
LSASIRLRVILGVAVLAALAAATAYEAASAPTWALLAAPFAAAVAAATGVWLFRSQMRRGARRPGAWVWAAAGASGVLLPAAPHRSAVIVMASLTALCTALLACALEARAWRRGTG